MKANCSFRETEYCFLAMTSASISMTNGDKRISSPYPGFVHRKLDGVLPTKIVADGLQMAHIANYAKFDQTDVSRW
jgi:hypothetical protein